MRPVVFTLSVLLLLGCQPQPDSQTTAQVTQLQHRLRTQQDSLRRLRQQLAGSQQSPNDNELQRQLQTQQDTLRRLRQQLIRTQQNLEETALMANAATSAATAAVGSARTRPSAVPAGTLYGKAAIVKLPDEEMAEVLSLADSTSSSGGEEFSVKAYRVCNGPADATLDYCNCSHYVYLALESEGMPYEYKLYRLGPFFGARLAGWTPGKDGLRGQTTLRIRHDVKGRQKTDAFRVGWRKVQRL